MDLGAVVSVERILLLLGPCAQWGLQVAATVLAANHEANLTGWVCRDGSVSVFDVGEHGLAVLLELGDQWKVEPLVLSY